MTDTAPLPAIARYNHDDPAADAARIRKAIAGDYVALVAAFAWWRTPQGDQFWRGEGRLLVNGMPMTAEAVAILEATATAWEAEADGRSTTLKERIA